MERLSICGRIYGNNFIFRVLCELWQVFGQHIQVGLSSSFIQVALEQ